MNINEIETILETLYARHANLDEAMLVTLLTAGGWEEKNIHDAIVLFRVAYSKRDRTVRVSLVPPEENHLLPQTADIAHTLTEHTGSSYDKEGDIVSVPPVEVSSPLGASPSSAIEKTEESLGEPLEELGKLHTNVNVAKKREDAIPENLPLRPFESNSHIWPFSLYKDVFNGPAAPLPKPVFSEKKKEEQLVEKNAGMHSLSEKEDKLTLLAEIMLGIVLLILAYMYSNGRL